MYRCSKIQQNSQVGPSYKKESSPVTRHDTEISSLQTLNETTSQEENPTINMEIISLNVGGTIYSTSLSTLQTYPHSMLGSMFSGRFECTRDKNGNYFIDRDGNLFRYVLNFLRNSTLEVPDNFIEMRALRKEAEFYQIEPLIEAIEKGTCSPRGDDRCFWWGKSIIVIYRYAFDDRDHYPELLLPYADKVWVEPSSSNDYPGCTFGCTEAIDKDTREQLQKSLHEHPTYKRLQQLKILVNFKKQKPEATVQSELLSLGGKLIDVSSNIRKRHDTNPRLPAANWTVYSVEYVEKWKFQL